MNLKFNVKLKTDTPCAGYDAPTAVGMGVGSQDSGGGAAARDRGSVIEMTNIFGQDKVRIFAWKGGSSANARDRRVWGTFNFLHCS
jgi:hypothetical protein